VVDDDSGVRKALATLLGVLGHSVVPAEGREALDYLEAGTSVDLVLTGLTMPDPDGPGRA